MVFGSTDLALKSAHIVDFCGKSSGLADFENTVNHGSLYFFTRIPDCASLMFGSWVLKEIWITDLSSALVLMSISSSKLFQTQLRDCYWNCAVL